MGGREKGRGKGEVNGGNYYRTKAWKLFMTATKSTGKKESQKVSRHLKLNFGI